MAYKVQFKKWQKEHPNFMTPYVIRVEEKGNYIIEVSEGTGFSHDKIYGVSLIKRKEDGSYETMHDGRSKVFDNKEEALSYSKKLKYEL